MVVRHVVTNFLLCRLLFVLQDLGRTLGLVLSPLFMEFQRVSRRLYGK